MRYLIALIGSAMILLPLTIRFRDGREGYRSREGEALSSATAYVPQYPYFEFAPPDGGSGLSRCMQTAPTGALGETMTNARLLAASCLKSDNFGSGILPGDMIVVGGGITRVELADTATGQLGAKLEWGASNLIPRGEELDNAAWTSTAAVAADTTAWLDGGVWADTLTDSSAIVLQGSSQVFTTAVQRFYSFSCFVKAGSANSATISIVGVGDSAGDCSATFTGIAANSITRIWCGSAATYTTASAMAVTIGVGDTADVQGTLIVGGCQLERSPAGLTPSRGYPTSYIPTFATSVARGSDNLSYTLPAPYASPTATVAAGCTRACMRPGLWAASNTVTEPGYLIYTGANGRGGRRETTSGTVEGWFDGTNDDAYPTNATQTLTSNTCWTSTFSGSARTLKMNATSAAGAYDGTWGIGVNAVQIGWSTTGGAGTSQPNGVFSSIRFDPQDAGACE